MKPLMLMLLLLVAGATQAATIETHRFDDPAREALYKKMIAELRCLVCQNQNLADSNAELAQDLRRKTYEMVSAGKSETEILAYMVERYGDFVLYRPPVKGITLFLWLGPFILLAAGLFVLVRVIRQRARVQSTSQLTEEERARADKLLEGDAP
ncbi:MAG: cytochrome c-type biogenesis protein CcmH [Gammaproteobacteria bacterium]|nr:cytochrome c-type biogenesis protein CcmH [Gammaproteobacteria bacterium]MBU1655698.1 cytochrome c-type biogenesis protein CcmH [Gammaproteobacteria bacterium]MBU1961186.1 cytochrome c-type biogenesis protein CcmH [Gammaproteobacteria bacterium]